VSPPDIGDRHGVDNTTIEVRGALFTDYFFTLPAVRGALAVHGSEMYGIVGPARPGRSVLTPGGPSITISNTC
jgi:hypothetical protein